MNKIQSAVAAVLLAGLGTLGVSGAASAGTWFLDARSCPDLREDYYDSRRDTGRADRREDRRDRRVINCPERSWTYMPDRSERYGRYDRGTGARTGTPGTVYMDRGRFYRRSMFGDYREIDVVVNYGYGHDYGRDRGRGWGHHDRHRGSRGHYGYRH